MLCFSCNKKTEIKHNIRRMKQMFCFYIIFFDTCSKINAQHCIRQFFASKVWKYVSKCVIPIIKQN